MNQDSESFYAARDLRTRQIAEGLISFSRPIKIYIGDDAATSRPGQVAALALTNMISRVHRTISISVSPKPLKIHSPIDADDLETAICRIAKENDPFISLVFTRPSEFTTNDDEISLGIGHEVPKNLSCYLGWSGGRAEMGLSPLSVGGDEVDLIGASTAACLGASAIFRLTDKSFTLKPRKLNLVERTEGDQAGTSSVTGSIDVGSVHLIGAGAVAHGLLYWMRETGHIGNWQVVDGDAAEIHNTNRCLGMTAADAGWPQGLPVPNSKKTKAEIAANLINAQPHFEWYDESDLQFDLRPDLIIPLANERNIREIIAVRGMPIVVHATTSVNWTAELHRHIPDRDDCLAFRFPSTPPVFACSTGPINPGQSLANEGVRDLADSSSDAALPFISAAAGLMLAIALRQLSQGEPFVDEQVNHWVLSLELGHRMWQSSIRSEPGCKHLPNKLARKLFQSGQPNQWAFLDPANGGL